MKKKENIIIIKKKKVELLNKVTAVEFVLLPAASLTELSCSVARAGRA